MTDARVTLRLPKELISRLRKEATKDNRSLNNFLRIELEKLVKKFKKELLK